MSAPDLILKYFLPLTPFILSFWQMGKHKNFPISLATVFSFVFCFGFLIQGKLLLGYLAVFAIIGATLISTRPGKALVGFRYWYLVSVVQVILVLASMGAGLVAGLNEQYPSELRLFQSAALVFSLPLVSLEFASRSPWILQNITTLILSRVLHAFLVIQLIIQSGGLPGELAPVIWIMLILSAGHLFLARSGLPTFISLTNFLSMIALWVSAWGPPLESRVQFWAVIPVIVSVNWILIGRFWVRRGSLLLVPILLMPIMVEVFFGFKANIDSVEQLVLTGILFVTTFAAVRESNFSSADSALINVEIKSDVAIGIWVAILMGLQTLSQIGVGWL